MQIKKYVTLGNQKSLSVSTVKFQVLSIYRGTSLIKYDYKIVNDIIERVAAARDLGVLINFNWFLLDHIKFVKSKSIQTLGFIKRISKHFSFKDTLYLYKTLVFTNFMLVSVMWRNQFYSVHISGNLFVQCCINNALNKSINQSISFSI